MKDLIERTYAHLPAADREAISTAVLFSPVRYAPILEAFRAAPPLTVESAKRILDDLRARTYGPGHRLAGHIAA